MARKANGDSGSLRFSARLKCTRPTRFQAGWRDLRNSWSETFRGRQFLVQGDIDIAPQRGQHIRRQILHARHRRRIGNQGIEILARGRDDRDLAAFGCGAQGGDVARGKITPPGPCGRQNAADFRRSQMQQAMPGAKGERIGEAVGKRSRQG